MSNKLTENDLLMLCYFYRDSRIERWSQWDDKKQLFEKEYPHLIDAIERLDSAKKTLDSIICEIEQKC